MCCRAVIQAHAMDEEKAYASNLRAFHTYLASSAGSGKNARLASSLGKGVDDSRLASALSLSKRGT